jgi:hypothetical protein
LCFSYDPGQADPSSRLRDILFTNVSCVGFQDDTMGGVSAIIFRVKTTTEGVHCA